MPVFCFHSHELSCKSSTLLQLPVQRLEMKRAREEDPVEAIDMAICLVSLSTVGESNKTFKNKNNRAFACKTCNREFSSFQALGGHRASHKKPRLTAREVLNQPSLPERPRTHECSVCGLEFAIGQALGGHMSRHRASPKSGGKKRIFGLDLNLTPMENDLRLQPVSPMVDCFI